MRTFDFSFLGGMPWTQDEFDFMQQAYQGPIKAIAAMGGAGPYIFYGMVSDGTNVTDGALYYGGDIIPFTGGPLQATVKITTYTTTLVYGDGTTRNTKTRKAASFIGTGSAVVVTFADLKLFHEGFGATARSGWKLFTGSNALSGQYLLNKLTGMVQVRGSYTHSQEVWTGGGGVPESKALATLPAELRPSATVYFQSNIETHHVTPINSDDGALFKSEIGRISIDGTFGITARKLQGSTASPTLFFNFSYQI